MTLVRNAANREGREGFMATNVDSGGSLAKEERAVYRILSDLGKISRNGLKRTRLGKWAVCVL